jgi:poly-gamma-glutamate synthesis protein (capsule biosynthesis protein)
VVGHGPHLLRGMEIYRGRPIFYSLGNFIAQNHLVYKIPADAYTRFRVDPSKTPGQLFDSREQGGKIGFAADARYWESVLPTCFYNGTTLQRIELTPISLGYGEPAHHRGRPRLARGEQASSILNRFAALSEPYGTRIEIDGDRACVVLGD